MSNEATTRELIAGPMLVAWAAAVACLATYQDFPLARATGSALAMSPFVLLGVAIGAAHAYRQLARRAFSFSSADKVVLLFLLWSNLIGLIQILSASASYHDEYLGVSYVTKLAKLNLYYLLPYVVFRHLREMFALLRPAQLAAVVAAPLLVNTVVLGIELASMPTALGWLHGGEFPYGRVRLLTSEASTSSSVVVVLVSAGLALQGLIRRPTTRLGLAVLALGFGVAYTAVSQSKGYLLLVGAAFAITAVLYGIRQRKPRVALVAFAGGTILSILLVPRVILGFGTTLAETTTVSTRGVLALSVLSAASRQPFGVGFGVYEQKLADEIPHALNALASRFPDLAMFTELDLFRVSSYGLFPKSGLFEAILFSGVVGFLIFVWAGRYFARLSRPSVWLTFGVVFLILALSSYLSFVNKYDIALFAAMVERMAALPNVEPSALPVTPPLARYVE